MFLEHHLSNLQFSEQKKKQKQTKTWVVIGWRVWWTPLLLPPYWQLATFGAGYALRCPFHGRHPHGNGGSVSQEVGQTRGWPLTSPPPVGRKDDALPTNRCRKRGPVTEAPGKRARQPRHLGSQSGMLHAGSWFLVGLAYRQSLSPFSEKLVVTKEQPLEQGSQLTAPGGC